MLHVAIENIEESERELSLDGTNTLLENLNYLFNYSISNKYMD